MSSKKNDKKKISKNTRRWTELEINVYADVLANPENSFAIALEKLALKKSANNEVFEHIQKLFQAELDKDDFKEKNSELLKNLKEPTKLNTSIEKLRQKYKWLKTEWTNKTNRAKNGSGLEPDQEPRWYQVINPVFSETNKPLDLVSSSKDCNNLSSSEEEEIVSGQNENEIVDVVNNEADNVEVDEPKPKKLKTVQPPHKKSEKIKSTKHGLSAIARGINTSIAAQDRRFERQLQENAERERRVLEFRAEEAEKNRQHEYRMAQLFLSSRQVQPAQVPAPTVSDYRQATQHYSPWQSSSSSSPQTSWPDLTANSSYRQRSHNRDNPYDPTSPAYD